jgi:hypothetical protein
LDQIVSFSGAKFILFIYSGFSKSEVPSIITRRFIVGTLFLLSQSDVGRDWNLRPEGVQGEWRYSSTHS